MQFKIGILLIIIHILALGFYISVMGNQNKLLREQLKECERDVKLYSNLYNDTHKIWELKHMYKMHTHDCIVVEKSPMSIYDVLWYLEEKFADNELVKVKIGDPINDDD